MYRSFDYAYVCYIKDSSEYDFFIYYLILKFWDRDL